MEKLKFWTPLIGGFFTIPGELSYLDGNFFKNDYILGLFMFWHCIWISLPFLVGQYL
jgi:hypothetical protein